MNPVLMVDEIDKMGSDVRGDPSSAMLEVLDPAQNGTFRDHYLDLPLDLSRILFLCTANVLETIPGPLLDRMEVIRLSGYTEEEKLHIARRYLLPRQIAAAGLPTGLLRVTDAGLRTVIGEYTREAGVRQLERRLGAIARRVARRVAEGDETRLSAGRAVVREILGPERIHNEVKRRTSEPGVATGLAVTGAGGEILFVEAIVMPGGGKLTVTGQLGDVMRESAQAAVSYVRARSDAPRPRPRRRLLLHPRHPPARPGRRGAEGRAVGGCDDGDGARVGALGPPRQRRRRDDGRDHPHRPGAPDRRRQGEGARGAARRHPRRDPPEAERESLADLPDGLADEMRITLADRIEQVLDVALEDGPAPDRGRPGRLRRRAASPARTPPPPRRGAPPLPPACRARRGSARCPGPSPPDATPWLPAPALVRGVVAQTGGGAARSRRVDPVPPSARGPTAGSIGAFRPASGGCSPRAPRRSPPRLPRAGRALDLPDAGPGSSDRAPGTAPPPSAVGATGVEGPVSAGAAGSPPGRDGGGPPRPLRDPVILGVGHVQQRAVARPSSACPCTSRRVDGLGGRDVPVLLTGVDATVPPARMISGGRRAAGRGRRPRSVEHLPDRVRVPGGARAGRRGRCDVQPRGCRRRGDAAVQTWPVNRRPAPGG